MKLKFPRRDYKAEKQVHSLHRVAAETHPLSLQSPTCDQVGVTDYGRDKFFDPLRGDYGKPEDSIKDLGSTTTEITAEQHRVAIQFLGKEWTSYKQVLMQKFPVFKMISVSSLSSSIMKTGKGHLIICLNDMKTLLMNDAHVASAEKTSGVLSGTRSSKLGLMEPAIEYVMKCLFKKSCELQVGDILIGLGLGRNQSELFGNSSCVSLVLHHLLRELPIGIICSNALDILHLIECSNDYSFDQCLNYKLLGLRLCENISHVNEVNLMMKKVIQNSYLDSILDGIFERTSDD